MPFPLEINFSSAKENTSDREGIRTAKKKKKRLHKEKKKYMNQQFEELQALNCQAKTRKIYQKISNGRKHFKPRITMGRDQTGKTVDEEDMVL